MPIYNTQCRGCQKTSEIRLTFSDYDGVRLGTKILGCASCSETVEIVFNPSDVSFILRDGESGGWAGKAIKENKLRARRREILAKRERDHVFKNKLQPNYEGMETGSWKETQAFVRDRHGEASASTYDSFVQREKTE